MRAKAQRLASLTTFAVGAARELASSLAIIVIVDEELEHALTMSGADKFVVYTIF